MGQSISWTKFTATVLGLSVIIHFIFGFLLDFSVDEAHYALYAEHLDWSYFDHPPLVGWIQFFPVWLNLSDGVIRLIPQLLWLICILISMEISKNLVYIFQDSFDQPSLKSVHWWTALILLAAPIMHVLAVGLLPDTLLIALVPAMILLTLRISQSQYHTKPQDLHDWIILGFVLGLSALAKYTSIFFAIGIPVCLMTWHGLLIFKRPGLWLCLGIAAGLTLPIWIWNYQNDWISFAYQLSHGAGGEWKFSRIFSFLLNQVICFGLLSILGIIWTYRRFLQSPTCLLSFFFIPFIIFTIQSGGGSSLPHWTSPAWVALAPFGAIGLANAWAMHRRFWIRIFISLQLGLCLAGFTFLFFGGVPTVSMHDQLGKKNPIADLYGWSQTGEKLQELSQLHQTTNLAVQNWTLGSRTAWYAKPLPVFVLDNRQDQFDLWFGELPIGSSAILLNWSQMSFELPIQKNAFEACKSIDALTINRLGNDLSQFEFFLCKNWQGQSNPMRSPEKNDEQANK